MPDKAMDNIYRYWGKAQSSENDEHSYHLLPYHCLDVAATGKVLLERQPALLRRLENLSGINAGGFLNWSAFLLAIHDIGKFADGFQNLKPDLFRQLQKRTTQVSYNENERHVAVGHRFCQKHIAAAFIKMGACGYKNNISEDDLRDLLEPWLCAVTGHHGKPPALGTFPQPIEKQFPNQVCNDAFAFIQNLIDMFAPGGLPFQLDSYEHSYSIFKRVSWLMAGLSVTADWIGSDRPWFPPCAKPMPLTDYWNNTGLPQAAKAVAESGLVAPGVAPSSGMRLLFPDISTPTPLQRLVEKVEVAKGPQLFIIEEVTGGGKTEAAFTLTHRLMANGLANGLFMALPTMATANAMHKRIRAVYKKLFLKNSNPSLILAHSTSKMMLKLERKNLADEGYCRGDTSASQDCAAWLMDSRKKALLADVGVGTIDQVLLAILTVRHQSLRLLGLARKVLIVDEVHACDAYMHRLLCTLLQFHSAHGGSAILLSATLPRNMRAELVKSFAEGVGKETASMKNNAYPLLTHFLAEDVYEISVATYMSGSRCVDVNPLHSPDEVNKALQKALSAGDCACWVRNTVYDALQAYREWAGRLGKANVLLFHARFNLWDRLRIEQKVVRCFGKDSKEKERRGKLLIATQVVEQSLDLDFDFMVSDLAPIDLLIQRAGRLQRHNRGPRKAPALGVYMPKPAQKAQKDWFKGMFPKAAMVYNHHGQLWLTADWMYKKRGFSMPDDAREMIEYVYGKESQEKIPEDLQSVEGRAVAENLCERGLGRQNSLRLDEGYQVTMGNWQDDVSAPTRLGEPTVTVRLARLDGSKLAPLVTQDTDHNWELSQLSIRQSQIAQEDPGNIPELVAAAKRTMSDGGRYCVVIPMCESEGEWTGRALDKQGRMVGITYNSSAGLEISKGKGE